MCTQNVQYNLDININEIYFWKKHIHERRISCPESNEMAQHLTTDEKKMIRLFLCIAIEGTLALQVQSEAGWRRIRHVKRMRACV